MKFLVISCFLFIAFGIIALISVLFLSSRYGFKCEEYNVLNPICLMTKGFSKDKSSVLPNVPLNRNVTLNFWGLFVPETAMRPLLDEYHNLNPKVAIKYDEKLYEGSEMGFYKDALKNRLESNQAPILFTVNSNWLPEMSNRLSYANNSISLKDYQEKYLPLASSTLVTTKQSILGIPYIYDGMALFYNKDLLAIENLEPPKTWDEARDVALATTLMDKESKSIVRYGLSIGNVNNVDNFSDIIGFMLAQNDVKVPNQFASNDAVTIYKRYLGYQRTDKIWGLDMPNSVNAFALNKVTLIFGKVSDIDRILAINPTLNFGVIELPQLPTLSGNRTNVGWGSLWANTVSNAYPGDEQKAAWDFLVWLNEEEQVSKLNENVLKVKQVGYIYSNKLFNEKETSRYLVPFINQANSARTSYFVGNSGNDLYVDILKEMLSGSSSSVSSSKLKEAAAKLNSTYQKLLPKTQ